MTKSDSKATKIYISIRVQPYHNVFGGKTTLVTYENVQILDQQDSVRLHNPNIHATYCIVMNNQT